MKFIKIVLLISTCLLLTCRYISIKNFIKLEENPKKNNIIIFDKENLLSSPSIMYDNNKKPYILTILDRRNMWLYNAETNNQIKIPNDGNDLIWDIFFAKTGELVSLSKSDYGWKIWDVFNRKEIITIHEKGMNAILSKDLNYLLISPFSLNNLKISVWNVKKGTKSYKIDNFLDPLSTSYCFNPNMDKFIIGDLSIQNYKLEDGSLLSEFKHIGELTTIVCSPDSRMIATGTGYQRSTEYCIKWIPIIYDPYLVKIIDLDTGNTIKKLIGQSGNIWSLAFSHDGKLLASGSRNGTAVIWDVDKGTIVHTLTGHSSGVTKVDFSPDDRMLFSLCKDNITRIWDVKTGSLKALLAYYKDKGLVVVANDGRFDGNAETVKNILLKIGNKEIRLDNCNPDLNTKGLLVKILNYK